MYGMSVPWANVTKLPDIADRACAYGMPGVVVDGMDVVARCVRRWPRRSSGRAAARARRSSRRRPTASTATRHSDHRAYRTREEEAEWKDRDPIDGHARASCST